jgi:N-acetylmuramoyl-L-alanine amidase
MKSAITFLLLMLLGVAWAGRALGTPRGLESASISGRAHVRVTDWARANGLETQWLKANETIQLSNHSFKLVLAAASRETQINGVAVWLLFPVVAHNGAIWLGQLDADRTLRPLLSPPKGLPGSRIKTICLDPGHGGKDPGNRAGSNQEKQYTLLLAKELRSQLGRAGLKVTLTRTADTFVELPTRPELAKSRSADLFISLHFNAAGTARDSVQGAEVYCLTPVGASSTNARAEGAGAGGFPGNRQNDKNMFLAFQMQKALTRNLAVEDRGVRRARFAVLRDATMPAVLIEAGFMSHPAEGRKIFSSAYRKKIAQAIVEGVLAYKKAVEQTS